LFSVALAILTAHLWSEFHQFHGSLMLEFHVTNVHENLRKEASDMTQSQAWAAVDKECEGWQKLVPIGRAEGVLPWLLEQDQSVVEGLLAAMVAVCIPGVSSSEKPDPTSQALMKAVSLDMTSWWKPGAENYLDHVSKTRIEAVVREAVHPQAALTLRDLKKPDMVSAAVKVLEDTKWLPDCLRPIDHDLPAANDPQGDEDDVRVG
jgi:ParB family chromosome partitioning protein